MLIVACNDGVMQQTREHFEVLRLLEVEPGIIVLSKSDLADDDTIELVKMEVDDLVAGSRWQQAPVVIVSSQSGAGMEELESMIVDLATRVTEAPRSDWGFILDVQRSFAIDGAGTVATGVCASGSLNVGDEVLVMPGKHESRVRRIHVHGRNANTAVPGLRTALNLPDITKEQCEAGAVVINPAIINQGKLLRVAISFGPEIKVPKNGSEVHLLSGTSNISGKLYCYSHKCSGFMLADIVVAENVFLPFGKRCLLRRPSPAENLGSLRFLGFADYKLRARDKDEMVWWSEINDLLDDHSKVLLHMMQRRAGHSHSVAELSSQLSMAPESVLRVLHKLEQQQDIQKTGSEQFVALGEAQAIISELLATVEHYSAKHPNRLRIPILNLRQRVGKEAWAVLQSFGDEMLAQARLIPTKGENWAIIGVKVNPEFDAKAKQIEQVLAKYFLQPPSWSDVVSKHGVGEFDDDEMRAYLLDSEYCIEPQPDMLFATKVVASLAADVVSQLQGSGMDIPFLRDKYQTSRKFLMPLLEYLDSRGLTERVGSKRILRNPDASLRD
jgi:selenocysteine-specific elongation factor